MTLDEWLKRSGTSVPELAEKLNVSRQTIYGWLNREFFPSYEHLIALHELSGKAVAIESFKPPLEVVNG